MPRSSKPLAPQQLPKHPKSKEKAKVAKTSRLQFYSSQARCDSIRATYLALGLFLLKPLELWSSESGLREAPQLHNAQAARLSPAPRAHPGFGSR